MANPIDIAVKRRPRSRLSDSDRERWNAAQRAVERAQLGAAEAAHAMNGASLAVQRLSLEFAERYELRLGSSPSDPHADQIEHDGTIMSAAPAPKFSDASSLEQPAEKKTEVR